MACRDIFDHVGYEEKPKMPRQAIFYHLAMKVNQKWPAGAFLIRLDRGSIDVGSTTAVFGKLDRQSGPSGRRARLNPSLHRCSTGARPRQPIFSRTRLTLRPIPPIGSRCRSLATWRILGIGSTVNGPVRQIRMWITRINIRF